MSATDSVDSSRPAPSVFLSYASEDRPAAKSVRDALEACGLEVWYDESGLDGGDAWDQKIRRQIRECDFFMPLISAQTEVRPEGYFRREWRLAVERTLDMADDHPFLLPVVIDDTAQAGARVPEKFISVQWVRAPGGQPTAALEGLCRRVLSGQRPSEPPKKSRRAWSASARSRTANRDYPEFPREEAGQRVRFWVQVLGWALQSGWIFFRRFPRWVRVSIYVWLAIVLMSRGCMPSHEHSRRSAAADTTTLSGPSAAHEANSIDADFKALGSQIAQQVTAEVGDQLATGRPLLAIPFSAPADNPAAQKLGVSMFAQVYGTVEHAHRGQVARTKDPLSAPDLSAAVERGRARHSKYVLYGAVDEAAQHLTVSMVVVADGSLLWSHSYPVADANALTIAADVETKVPTLED